MIYCVTIQSQSGEVLGAAKFEINKDSKEGIDCLGYTMGGQEFPACSVWDVFDRLVESMELDGLHVKTKQQLLEVAAYTKR